MTFLMICKRPECRAEYEADGSDIAKGIRWWSLCPSCRLSDAAELPQIPTISDSAGENELNGAA